MKFLTLNVLTWLECLVDQAGLALRAEQAIAKLASVNLYCSPNGESKQQNFW